MSDMATTRPRRLLRSSKACKAWSRLGQWRPVIADVLPIGDFCHRRRIKCRASPLEPSRCQNCVDFDIACTYQRPSNRGAGSPHLTHSGSYSGVVGEVLLGSRTTPRPGVGALGTVIDEGSRLEYTGASTRGSSSSATDNAWSEALSSAWQGFAQSCTPTVQNLLSIYQDVVHPM
jgi:hypothetical protein